MRRDGPAALVGGCVDNSDLRCTTVSCCRRSRSSDKTERARVSEQRLRVRACDRVLLPRAPRSPCWSFDTQVSSEDGDYDNDDDDEHNDDDERNGVDDTSVRVLTVECGGGGGPAK